MNDATTRAMRDLWERSSGQAQVKVVIDRTGSAAMRETRYEMQRLDGRGEIIRHTTNLRYASACELARQECAA